MRSNGARRTQQLCRPVWMKRLVTLAADAYAEAASDQHQAAMAKACRLHVQLATCCLGVPTGSYMQGNMHRCAHG